MMEVVRKQEVRIPDGRQFLEGRLVVPENPQGMVVFAHGSRSSRFSPRNTMVAHKLQTAGFGTFLFDMVTAMEDRDPRLRNDIGRMSARLQTANRWLMQQPDMEGIPAAYFGSGTGAAVAIAASVDAGLAYAIVSRGGRLDMVREMLPQLRFPIHLISGAQDPENLAINQMSYRQINAVKKISVIRDATHLFEEPGCMEMVAQLSRDWFNRHLP
jgi:pimeloyl-ACP methyl ester carboxylesterase